MTYDFDTPISRRGTHSLKWDVEENVLPMWVADMDFQTAPEIIEAVQERADHGIYGYTIIPGEWYEAVAGWWETRHGFQMDKKWLMFCTGVIPAISSVIRMLTAPGDQVLVQTPVYNHFFSSIENNGRRVLENRLRYDKKGYHIDFEDLEQKLSDPQTTLFLLCNPHNPAGILWDKETLFRIGSLCRKHHVPVLSDEIHCDLTDPKCNYIPFASVSGDCRDNSVTCIAPTKTFNLAGLHTAAVMAPDEVLYHRVSRGLNTDEIAEPNAFAVTAAVAAYTRGGPWLDSLCSYLYENKRLAREFLQRELTGITAVPSEATYLLWLDCTRILGNSTKLCEYLRRKTGLYLSDGSIYRGNGGRFLRMNVACPRRTLLNGLERLREGILTDYEKWAVSLC